MSEMDRVPEDNVTINSLINLQLFESVISGFYGFLFVIGIAGNLWVLFSIRNMIQSKRGYHKPYLKGQQSKSDSAHFNFTDQDGHAAKAEDSDHRHHAVGRVQPQPGNFMGINYIYIYIVSLSIADFMVIAVIPMLITYTVTEQWIFGKKFGLFWFFLCKIFWTVEGTNKLLSTILLTALSFDRYITVCHDRKYMALKTSRAAGIISGFCVFLSVFILMPVIIHTKVQKGPSFDGLNNITTCSEVLPENVSEAFFLLLFIMGYCAPGVLIIGFYSQILWFLRKQSRQSMVSSTHLPVRTITLKILILIFVYFFCWTPYWIVCIAAFMEYEANWFLIFSFIIHTLPYLNSATNWILYALLNNELRQHSVIRGLRRHHEEK